MTATVPTADLVGCIADVEEWRPVVEWEGIYEVSSLGRVSRQAPGRGVRPSTRLDGRRILKTSPANHGYPQVGLSRDGNKVNVPVHWLVAEAFIGPRTETVDHIDGDRTNNRVPNLRYLPRAENARAAWDRLGRDQGRLAAAKLTPAQVLDIRRRVAAGETQAAVAKAFGISSGHCNRIVHGALWSDLPERIFGVAVVSPKPRRAAQCGTRGGYDRHQRSGGIPCEACSSAYRLIQQEYYLRNRDRRLAKARERRCAPDHATVVEIGERFVGAIQPVRVGAENGEG